MHELQLFQLRMRGAQRLDHAVAQPAAAVHRHARGFIDDDEIAILVDHGARDELAQGFRGGRRLFALLGGDGRNPDPIAGAEPMVGFYAPAVHTNLPGSQNPVDETSRHVLEHTHQEIIDPLTLIARFGQQIADALSLCASLAGSGSIGSGNHACSSAKGAYVSR